MKYLGKYAVSVLVIGVGVLCLASCVATGGRIEVGERWSIRSILNVHESPVRWLRVGGKEYLNVIGGDPCYIEMKDLGFVLFLTEGVDHKIYANFASLSGGAEIAFPVSWYFRIGSPSIFKISLLKASWPTAIILVENDGYVTRHEFNLELRTYSVDRVHGDAVVPVR